VKACPVVFRQREAIQVLAFEHPLAGYQLCKGTVEAGETPADAALRELREEAGIAEAKVVEALGECLIDGQRWSFHRCVAEGLSDEWRHRCADDDGHTFRFFWHPLHGQDLAGWHLNFSVALAFIRAAVPVSLRSGRSQLES
jgi:8-oxo-dGTP pyrophosphatase MutT (NUDIX family)